MAMVSQFGTMIQINISASVWVSGDKVWSFASRSLLSFIEGVDLVYHFEGTPVENPTHFNIIPEAQYHNAKKIRCLLQSRLKLWDDPYVKPVSAEHDYTAVGDRPEAVMDARSSQIFGFGLESSFYKVAQIINGKEWPRPHMIHGLIIRSRALRNGRMRQSITTM